MGAAAPPSTSDLLGAAAVVAFAGIVIVAYHRTPRVNEAIHYYKEHDRRAFVAMRSCYYVIATATVLNARHLVGWAMHGAWLRYGARLAPWSIRAT